MKREEILDLIDAKEAKELVAKQHIQDIFDFNTNVFNDIKQSVIDKLIKKCILNGYQVALVDVNTAIVDTMVESRKYPLSRKDVIIHSPSYSIGYDRSCIALVNCSGKDKTFYSKIIFPVITKNVLDLLLQHGFIDDGYNSWYTTKENLLSYPEIIHKGVKKVDRSKLVELTKQEDDKVVLGALKVLAILLVVIVLWIFTYLVF